MNDIAVPPHDQNSLFQLLESTADKHVDQLVEKFSEEKSRQQGQADPDLRQFLTDFFIFANELTDRSSLEFAKVVRANTDLEATRAITVNALAKSIRNDVFEPLDAKLLLYAQALAKLDPDFIESVQVQAGQNIAGGLMEGALAGRFLGGFGKSGNFMAEAGGVIGALSQMAARDRAVSEAVQIQAVAVGVAVDKIHDYLLGVPTVLESLIDDASTQLTQIRRLAISASSIVWCCTVNG